MSSRNPARLAVAVLVASALLVAACGDDDTTGGSGDGTDRPTVVVTTSELGDVVEQLAGDAVEVETIMPVGADPHSFQASARQANEMREADALVVNGAGLEEGLLDVIDAAEDDGVPTHEAISAVDTIAFGAADHHEEEGNADDHEDHDDDHEGEDHDDDHEDAHGHDHDGVDPHFFLDPARMAVAAQAIGDFLIERLDGVDRSALEASVADYVAELEALDAEVEELLGSIPEDRRVLVTNHDAFGYFADRYGFEVVGTVIPSGSTADGTSAGDLAELADTIRDEGVPAVFAETTNSDELAQTLASEVGGDVEVVELFTDSLGDEGSGAATYLDLVRTDAERIAEALA